MADLYLERIGLARPTIVERDNNGEIERLESVGLDIASLVAFWRRCFDLDGLLFEKIILHCKSKDFNAIGGRTLATVRSVRELLAEQGVECVIDDEWFKEKDKELKACNEKQAELEAEIERLKADNEAYTEENKKLKLGKHKLENDLVDFDKFARSIMEYLEKEKHSAVKEFVEKLKAKAHSVVGFNVRKKVYAKEYTINEIDIDELLREYEQ